MSLKKKPNQISFLFLVSGFGLFKLEIEGYLKNRTTTYFFK